ncbi:MAG: DUF871 domain-containing protein [Bacilli bacterium]|nr:DUF871 domain-containing protein [Bacilli bacterium]
MIDTGISVYAGLDDYSKEENVKYLRLAKDLGCTHVFSSAHINEAKTSQEELQSIIDECNKLGLKLSLDVSKKIIDKYSSLEGLFALRLDYGFTDEEIIELSHTAPYLVELNASTLSYEHIKSLIDNGINTSRTRFTFNFYPKLYSGHDILDVYNKTKICNEVGIYVGAFIPSHTGFRPPMYEGLPTVEAHRSMILDNAIEELKACGINGIYFGDAYASSEEIKTLNMHNTSDVLIKLSIYNNEYDYIYDKSFRIRPDLNSSILRVSSVRSNAEISAFNTVGRKKYDVTIDNSKFKRYAGEINIVLKDLPNDERVNVIGKIDSTDIIINNIKRGNVFKFIK